MADEADEMLEIEVEQKPFKFQGLHYEPYSPGQKTKVTVPKSVAEKLANHPVMKEK